MRQTKPRLESYEDPNDSGNSPRWHTGKPCIEKDCTEPAGTAWSPFWCFKHNAERIRSIDRALTALVQKPASPRGPVGKGKSTKCPTNRYLGVNGPHTKRRKLHPCPYMADIHDNPEPYCECCSVCTAECADDV